MFDKFFEGYNGLPGGISAEAKKKISKIIRDEIENEKFEDTAWLDALSQADGNKTKAKGKYIKLRFDQLFAIFKNEMNLRIDEINAKEQSNQRTIELEQKKISDNRTEVQARAKLIEYSKLWFTNTELEKLPIKDRKKYNEAKQMLLQIDTANSLVLQCLDEIKQLRKKIK